MNEPWTEEDREEAERDYEREAIEEALAEENHRVEYAREHPSVPHG